MDTNEQPSVKPRLNPMELKRQREAKRRKTLNEVKEINVVGKSTPIIQPPIEQNLESIQQNVKESTLEEKLKSIINAGKTSRVMKKGVNIPISFDVESIPMDWTLKSKVIFKIPFKFPQRMNGISFSKTISHSMIEKDMTLLTPSEAWNASLHQYIHPSISVPAQTDTGAFLGDEFTMQRLQIWQEAFRNLYYTFHHEKHDVFYLATPQSVVCFYRSKRKQPVNLSFRHLFDHLPTIDSVPFESHSKLRDGISIVISITTSTMRREMLSAGIEYTLPFADNATSNSQIANERQHRAIDIQQSQQVKGMDTLVLVQGAIHVHGVFDLLLNQPGILSTSDVPILCARFPFQHGAISPLQFRNHGIVSNSNSSDYMLEVSGCILPNTLTQLAESIKRETIRVGQEKFSILLEPWHGCNRMNICGWDCDTNINQILNQNEQETIKRYIHQINWEKSNYHLLIKK